MTMRARFLVVILGTSLGLLGCHSKQRGERTTSLREMIGLYEVGYEPGGFRICDDTTLVKWRGVRFLPGVSPSHWPATRTTDRTRMVSVVRWKGEITIPGRPGAVRYPSTVVVVHEVLDVRAARVGDCGWEGN